MNYQEECKTARACLRDCSTQLAEANARVQLLSKALLHIKHNVYEEDDDGCVWVDVDNGLQMTLTDFVTQALLEAGMEG